MRKRQSIPEKKIQIVIVDDSVKYRAILRSLLEGHARLDIIGEAVNGIEALELIWEKRPDVVVMEYEMPLMDGTTALQHLMIHIPTPTILFSRLTREGSARSFDAIKNGAVDFIGNEKLAELGTNKILSDEFVERVIRAAGVVVKPLEPFLPSLKKKKKKSYKNHSFL